MGKQPGRVYAADLARELGMNEKVARAKLREAGFKRPYFEKDRKKLIAALKQRTN
jgi:hypothetical protein